MIPRKCPRKISTHSGGWGGQIIPTTCPHHYFFTFRHLWLAIEDDPAILLRSLLQTRKSFNFFLMTTWQSSLYYTNVPLHIRFRKKFHSSFELFALNPLFISYDKWYFVSEIFLTCCEKIVFCYQNCSDLLWEKIVLVIEKNFWISRLRIFKIFEITRTIYSNSERSEQFLVTECFFNLFWRFRTMQIQIGKNNWDSET